MQRILAWLVIAALTLGAAGAQAQSLFDPTPEPVDGDAARALAEILSDKQARESLIRQLLASAEAAEQPGEAAPPEQMSLARQVAEQTRGVAEGVIGVTRALTASLGDVFGVLTGERTVDWAELQSVAVALALVAAVTLALFFGLRVSGTRVFRRMSDRANGGGWVIALIRLLGSSLIDALIIVLAWGGGYAFALAIGEAGTMDFRQSLFLNAFLLVEMTKVILRAIFSPGYGRLRFAPMGDETAAYWYFWASRLVSMLGYGILLLVPIVNETVSHAVGRSLTLLVVVIALLIAILVVLQNRHPIRDALRARHERDPDDVLGRLEAWLGAVWHWLAILYLVTLFLVWTAQPEIALQFMLVATLQSAVAVVIGVVATLLISRAIKGGLRVPEHVRESLPLLEDRLNAFVPALMKGIRAIIAVLVLIAIGQAWQVLDFLGWLSSEVGRDTMSRVVSAALVALIALAMWIGVSSFVEYRLNPSVGTVPTARERTLLALFRNAFMVVLVVIAAMLALSELGVNIAPLLAGAGVLGLAIGFGAQKLVQDIITGAFIQVENAMNEGDFVTAGGTTGAVERLTIRSVGLRDTSGTYHLIPFSAVDTVSNFTKDYGYHLAEVGVAYREDVAEVKELMFKAFERLMDTELGAHILEPMEMQGVTRLGDSSVVVRSRMKTAAGMQWAVGRGYNEIIKSVLDEAGVEIPYPHMTLYMGQGKDGNAPPLNLRHHGGGSGGTPAVTGPVEPAASERSAPQQDVDRFTDAAGGEVAPPSHDDADTN